MKKAKIGKLTTSSLPMKCSSAIMLCLDSIKATNSTFLANKEVAQPLQRLEKKEKQKKEAKLNGKRKFNQSEEKTEKMKKMKARPQR